MTKKRRGVTPRGSACGLAILTDDDVIAIRAACHGGPRWRPDLAERFGVSPWTVYSVVAGKTWAHLPMPPTDAELRSAEIARYRSALEACIYALEDAGHNMDDQSCVQCGALQSAKAALAAVVGERG